jgi:3-dehydroquinate synthase
VPSITVGLGERSYPIHVGVGLLARVGELLASLPSPRVVVVTNPTVARHHSSTLERALAVTGIRHETILVPDGERHKDWATLYEIHTRLLELGAERSTAVVALGGGVVGDLAGFAAATYQRGVPLVQVPTTLLAQVDSSVGGKTAVNHPLGKNMIGAFYQPRLVVSDIATLGTLPAREYVAGIAEIIKYGVIRDVALFEWLESNIEQLVAREPDALEHAVTESCRTKSEIVAADERESGERALLNFGHTFAHAIETATGYETWLHGEAVAAGMIIATTLSERVTDLPPSEGSRIRALIARVPGFTRRPPELEAQQWQELISHDKKTRGGLTRFVLLTALGKSVVCSDVAREEISHALADAQKNAAPAGAAR